MKRPDFSSFAICAKTLYCEWPGRVGVLVTVEGGKASSVVKKFRDARAALAWCERNRAAFVYLPPSDPSEN